MPTLVEVEADPKFKSMSPEAQMLVRRKLTSAGAPGGGGGGGGGTTGGNAPITADGMMAAVGSTVKDEVTGAGKRLASDAVGAGKLANAVPFPLGLGANKAIGMERSIPDMVMPSGKAGSAAGAYTDAQAGLEPQNLAEKIGGVGADLAEGVVGAKAVTGTTRALLGTQMAKSRLPIVMKLINVAKSKGAVPGHGMVPRVLSDEVGSLVSRLVGAGEQIPADVGSVAGETGSLTKLQKLGALGRVTDAEDAAAAAHAMAGSGGGTTTMDLVKKALPYILNAGTFGAGMLAKKIGHSLMD